MSAPRRRATRPWYRRAVAPLLVLAALGGVYLLALSGLGHVAFGAFLVNNDTAATRAATAMSAIGAVERYRGPFAEGTAAAAQAENSADLAVAEESLREALALADPVGECAVRYNLALVLEAAAQEVEKGDQPEALRAAEARYREAAAVAAAAPVDCAQVPSGHDAANRTAPPTDEPPERSAADDLEEAASRASTSADAAAREAEASDEDGSGGQRSPDEPEPTPPPVLADRQSELEERMGRAHETEQRRSENGSGEGAAGDGAPQVPAPW